MVELSKAGPFDYIRFVISAILLLFSLIVTSYAIWQQNTMFWSAVPGYAALILFVVDLCCLGIVEGLQIALVELKRQHPDSYKKSHPRAYKLGQIAARGDNVERFLMGRQVCVVVLVFFAAKLTTIHLAEGEQFLFPVPQWVESAFFETGFLACIVVVIIAQLMPQIVAAKFPVHFLQSFIMYPTYYICYFLEATGITHICWVLSYLLSRAMGMKDDETTKNPIEFLDGSSADTSTETLDKVGASLETGLSTITQGTFDDMKKVPLGEDDEKYDNNKNGKNLPILEPIHQQHFSQYSVLIEELNKTIDADTLTVLRHYLDSHPEKCYSFPSVVGNKVYSAPQHLAEEMKKKGLSVPRFLTDISDPEHIPPHIVACELLGKNRQLQEEIKELKRKLYGPDGNIYVKL